MLNNYQKYTYNIYKIWKINGLSHKNARITLFIIILDFRLKTIEIHYITFQIYNYIQTLRLEKHRLF